MPPFLPGGPNVGPAPPCDNFSSNDQVFYTKNTNVFHSNLSIIPWPASWFGVIIRTKQFSLPWHGYVLFSNVAWTNVQTSGISTVYQPFWALSSASVGKLAVTNINNKMAIIGTKGLQLNYWPFTLTISFLTRDNHQQIRLFVNGIFSTFNSVFSLFGNTFVQLTTQPWPVIVFPRFNRNKQQNQYFAQNWLFSTKTNDIFFERQLTYLSFPPRPL